MQISPSVRAAMVPDENPMHPGFTSIYLVGPKGGQSLTIDSGEAFERYQWFLRGYLAAVEQTEISIATITHHHQDHSGNLKWAKEMLGARIDITQGGRPLLKGKIPTEVNQLNDGDTIDLGSGVRVQVLHTPGHSVDSMSYYLEDEGVLFTGDTLLGSSTTTVRDLCLRDDRIMAALSHVLKAAVPTAVRYLGTDGCEVTMELKVEDVVRTTMHFADGDIRKAVIKDSLETKSFTETGSGAVRARASAPPSDEPVGGESETQMILKEVIRSEPLVQ